jgi:hypothetical protein
LKKKYTISYLFARLGGWVILFNLFNTLIDAGDRPRPLSHLAYNEMESITEWVLEDVLGMPNAVPEDEDNDTEKKSRQFQDWEDYFPLIPQHVLINYTVYTSSFHKSLHLSPLLSVITPPPDQYS